MPDLSSEFDPFMALWHGLPRNTNSYAPSRRDINPATFSDFLQYIGMAERRGHQDLRVLFYGSGIERISGFSITGCNYFDLLAPEMVEPMTRFYDLIFSTPCAAYVADLITLASGTRYLFETVHLPVADETGTIQFLLAYGRGRKPYTDLSDRAPHDLERTNIKDMFYIDLGAGAPTAQIRNFEFLK